MPGCLNPYQGGDPEGKYSTEDGFQSCATSGCRRRVLRAITKAIKEKKSVARREQRERRLQGGVSPGVLAVERKQ